ncbi:MAG: biosynthetic-type acetolactate synthase large subunit [Bacillota bacterium]
MERNGAQIVLECLLEQGVDTIFGYPGGAVIPLYDALYSNKDRFTHILTAHEQGAVHGADGYARATGRVGVCFATSGPGATNTVTGIATAYMDSVPIIVFTGQVSSGLIGRDSFQEIDITGITLPITKHNYLVRDVNQLADSIREAFEIARSGRPGPVLIDIPKDVFMAKTEYQAKDGELSTKPEINGPNYEQEIKEIVERINQAERPIIYAGGGVIHSEAAKELYEFAVKGDIPVVNTLMGLGGFSGKHRLFLGMVGMHGQKQANLAVTHSDLVIAVGARFSDRVIGDANKFAPKAKVIQIDIDRAEIGKNKVVDYWLLGDVKEILQEICQHIHKKDRKSWYEEINQWRIPEKADESEFHPRNILKVAQSILEEDAIVVTEVGQNQMWTAQYWKFETPRTFLSSGGLGTMGYGLGAAIGASLAFPERRILHIAGDGCFRMNCNELATVAKYKIPLITLLLNNGTLGMVRQWQKLFHDGRYAETDITQEVDYVKLAEAFGLCGSRVDTLEGLEEALKKAKESRTATVIECVISKDDCVFPIVPPGKPITDIILE